MHLSWKEVTTNRHACMEFNGELEPKMAPNFWVPMRPWSLGPFWVPWLNSAARTTNRFGHACMEHDRPVVYPILLPVLILLLLLPQLGVVPLTIKDLLTGSP